MDSGNAWLAQEISGIRMMMPHRTIAVVVHQSEIKDGKVGGILPAEMTESVEFRQDLNMSSSYWQYSPKRLLILQKGKEKDGASPDREGYRQLGVTACQSLQSKKAEHVTFLLSEKVAASGMVGIFENAFYLTNWENSHKKIDYPDEDKGDDGDDDKDVRLKRVTKKVLSYDILCEKEAQLQTEQAKFWRAMAHGTEYARFLCNTRGSVGTPGWMESQVHDLVQDHPLIKECRVLQSDQLQQLGMNMFWNVGKGAISKPRYVMVHYLGDPSRENEVDVAFVGKGVTYDTGGHNLKASGQMEDMYGDKGGACAVLGALKGTMELGLKKNIIFSCGFAENAIGAECFLGGDIITAMNGLGVEINNTDAEGRLVMGDCFTYVQREFKPKQLIDIATLTGACMLALGTHTAGVFSEDDALLGELKAASKDSFEPIWHLPITDEHKESIKGKYGDIMNTGATRMGGASTAAAFLLRFVEGDTKWAHLDIAGPSLRHGAKPPVCSDQTGFGAGLLINFIKNKN